MRRFAFTFSKDPIGRVKILNFASRFQKIGDTDEYSCSIIMPIVTIEIRSSRGHRDFVSFELVCFTSMSAVFFITVNKSALQPRNDICMSHCSHTHICQWFIFWLCVSPLFQIHQTLYLNAGLAKWDWLISFDTHGEIHAQTTKEQVKQTRNRQKFRCLWYHCWHLSSKRVEAQFST